jgi:hypothetical protein
MKKIVAILALTLLSAPGQAEVGAKDLTLAGVGDCLKEAISANALEDAGDAMILSCRAEKARTLFNILARKVRVEAVQDKNGKFENRQFGNNACYHRIEDPDGKPANDFRCDLVLVTGDALKG